MHPEIQDKLFEEIDALESIDHETIQDMAYLEAAIHENLRWISDQNRNPNNLAYFI